MKHILIVFTFCICTHFSFSQNKKLDSLLVLLKTQKEDTLKATTYLNLCKEIKSTDFDKLKQYNDKLLQLSQKINFKKGVGLYYWNFSRIKAANNEAKEAIAAAQKAKLILYPTNDWDNYFSICAFLSLYLVYDNQYQESELLLETSLKRALINNRPNNVVQIYNQLIGLYSDQLRYKEALFYAKKSINYQCDNELKIQSYEYTAEIYISLGNYLLSREYFDKAISLAKEDNTRNGLLVRKAATFFKDQKFKEGLNILLPLEQYYEKCKNYNTLIITSYNIAKFYYFLEKYNEAYIHINKVLANLKKNDSFSIDIYTLSSKINLKMKQKIKALQNIDKATNLLTPNDNLEVKQELYVTKSEVEEAMGNYKTALSYYKKQATLKEEFYIENNKNKINELQVNFKVTDKENSIKKLEIAQLQKTVENKKQRENLLYVSVALLLALLSTFFYVRNNRVIKNKNKIIELTNIKLENEKQLTQKSLVEKETLLKEIHHRVKNNMQLVMSLLNIQSQEANNNISDFVAVSQSRILSMSLIHENLYQTDNLSQVDFKEYVENLTNSILNAYSNINTTITLKLEIEPVYFDIQKAIPLGLIINELVNNAYKHAFINNQKGLITLKLIRKNKKYELVVCDNGVGIQKKENAKKTLGLELVEELVFQLDGLLKVANNKGLQYNIQF